MPDADAAIRLWVVIPCHNEAAGIAATLAALAGQTDPGFRLLVVDNASTDATRRVVEDFRSAHPGLQLQCVDEPQKGTGAAADTGFRAAIAAGATHVARTDADCLPNPDWVEGLKRAFRGGAEFVAGAIHLRDDDHRIGRLERGLLGLVAGLMALIAPWLPHNRGPEFKTGYVMAGGGNLALTAALYQASGGFPRIALEDDNDDRVLVNRVRRIGAVIRRDRRVVVRHSIRRIRRYGIRGTVLWYWNRQYRQGPVDVR